MLVKCISKLGLLITPNCKSFTIIEANFLGLPLLISYRCSNLWQPQQKINSSMTFTNTLIRLLWQSQKSLACPASANLSTVIHTLYYVVLTTLKTLQNGLHSLSHVSCFPMSTFCQLASNPCLGSASQWYIVLCWQKIYFVTQLGVSLGQIFSNAHFTW